MYYTRHIQYTSSGEFLNYCSRYSAGMRGPPTSGAPPVSAAQPYSQFGQSEVQNGPPSMGAPPQRSRFRVFLLRDIFLKTLFMEPNLSAEVKWLKSAVETLSPKPGFSNASISLNDLLVLLKVRFV